MSNQQRLWGSTLRSPIASPHLSGLTTCLAWAIQLNALMSKFYAEPVLCLKDEHRLRPPCRVAAEASSAALPSCQLLQLLPAAWKPAGISGCGRAGPASGAPLLCPAQGTTARRPHLQWELLLQHSRLLQQLFGSDGFKFLCPLHCISLVNVAQCTFPPDPDNRWVASCPLQQIAGWHSRLFLHRRHIFH